MTRFQPMQRQFAPDKEAKARKLHAANAARVAKLVRKAPIKGKVIELGSGAGWLSMLLSREPEISEVVACEIDPTTIDAMKDALEPVFQPDWSKMRYHIGSYQELDFRGQFDVAVFCSALNETPDLDKSFASAASVLKPGGLLILHNEHIYPWWWRKARNGYPFTLTRLKARLRHAGLKPRVIYHGKNLPWIRFQAFGTQPNLLGRTV